jgi:PAS domain S-box-containing protein
MSEHNLTPGVQPNEEKKKAESIRVLLVEDSSRDSELIVYELVRGGFTPDWRRIETEAAMREALEADDWDLVISDYSLPQFNGLAALGVLRSLEKDIPFIIVSGTIGEETAVEVMKAGANDYLMKNNLIRLVPAVSRELAEAKTRHERRQAEEIVQLHNAIVTNMMEGIQLARLDDLKIIYTNPRFDEMFGYRKGELIGKNVGLLNAAGEQSAEGTVERISGSLMESGRWSGELCNLKKDGTIFWTRALVSKLQHPRLGSLSITVQEDITERKRAEEALRSAKEAAEEANRAKSIFLANMSHEIRTPMNSIMGMAHLLSSTSLTEEQQQYLDLMHYSARNLQALIDDILNLSHIESGKVNINETVFDPVELVEKCARLLEPAATKKGLKIRRELSGDVERECLGDPMRLRQVLLELLNNAIKYTSSGEICMRLEKTLQEDRQPFLEISVSDTGPGIPSDKLDAIFESFVQLNMTTTKETSGTGLGLSIVRKLMELMGGSVDVRSEAGRGSVFTCTLPLREVSPEKKETAAVPAETAPIHSPDMGKYPTSILVVDDDAIGRFYISILLKQAGFEVAEAQDGLTALEKLKNGSFDIVLIDLQMPNVDGMETTRRLRLLERETGRPRTFVMALTAYSGDNERNGCRSAGMDDFLSKPFEQFELMNKIEEALIASGKISK